MYRIQRPLAIVAISLEVVAFVNCTHGNFAREPRRIGALSVGIRDRDPYTLPDIPERPLEAENVTRTPAGAHVTPTVVGNLSTFSIASLFSATV